uniref:EF-hand domain family member B n=1 Tax=Equus caballus TaxID=9796 RepID=F7DEC2_HORSE
GKQKPGFKPDSSSYGSWFWAPDFISPFQCSRGFSSSKIVASRSEGVEDCFTRNFLTSDSILLLTFGGKWDRKPDCANPAEANVDESEPTLLIKPEDTVLKEPGSSENTLRTLLRPSDKVSNHYKTTSSEICAVVGAVPSTCYPIYGVPTIRSDLPAPRIRRVSDRTNYGEEGNAYSLLHPSIFAQKGVFERDFFKTRSKKEIAEILCNIGVKLSDEEFEHVWNLASKKHHRGEVCVENIRNVLDELQHADRIKCKTTM